MGTEGFGGAFAPIVQYEKWEIHPVFPHFPYFRLCQNLSPNLLAPLCGAALITQQTENPNPVFSACGWLNGTLSNTFCREGALLLPAGVGTMFGGVRRIRNSRSLCRVPYRIGLRQSARFYRRKETSSFPTVLSNIVPLIRPINNNLPPLNPYKVRKKSLNGYRTDLEAPGRGADGVATVKNGAAVFIRQPRRGIGYRTSKYLTPSSFFRA